MKKLFSLLSTARLIVALVAICLLAAPFSPNCCAQLSCEPPGPSAHAESPCHGTMAAQAKPSATFHSARSMCPDAFLVLQVLRAEEFTKSGNDHLKSRFPIPLLAETARNLGWSWLRSNGWAKSGKSLRTTNSSLTLTRLKL
jgi:hypothetical protein